MTATVTVYVRPDDPDCALTLHYLRERGVEPVVRDVTSDPSASAVLFGRLGRIAVPTVQVGERLLVGYDPLQLARFLPTAGDDQPGVSFGAAVRTVSAELARRSGLPWAHGVEVGPVRPGSPAEVAGVLPGDLIVGIGAYTVQDAGGFRTAVAARHPGDTMALTLWRDGAEIGVSVEFPRATVEPQDATTAETEAAGA